MVSVNNNSLDDVQRLPRKSDPNFDRKLILANALGSLMQAAHECGEQLRRDGVALTRENLNQRSLWLCLPKTLSGMTVGWSCGNEAVDGRVSDTAVVCYPVAVHEASAA
jgi:hypothetical protein